MADIPSIQTAAGMLPCQLRLALACIITPLVIMPPTIVVLALLWFAIPPGFFLVPLALELVVAILGLGFSIYLAVNAFRARTAGTFVLGLTGFVLNGSLGIFSSSAASFFLNWHGFHC